MVTGLAALGGVCALPWWSVADDPVVVSASRADFEAYVTPQAAAGTSIFLTQYPNARDPEAPPHAVAFVQAGRGEWLPPSNQVEVTFVVNQLTTPRRPFPPDEVLPKAQALVELMVRVWEPDYAALDTSQMHNWQGDDDCDFPTLGFVAWVDDSLRDGAPDYLAALAPAPYAGGTLYAMDLASPTLGEDGLALAEAAHDQGGFECLLPLQGDPASIKFLD
jgi:hypothetical protein